MVGAGGNGTSFIPFLSIFFNARFLKYRAQQPKQQIQAQKKIVEAIATNMASPASAVRKLNLGGTKLLTPVTLTEITIYVGNEVGCSVGRTLGCDDGRLEG